MNVTFGELKTKYQGRRLKVAKVVVNGKTTTLALNDTVRCAQGDGAPGEEIAARVLRNLGRAAGDPEDEPTEEQARLLHLHCRTVLGLQPEKAAA